MSRHMRGHWLGIVAVILGYSAMIAPGQAQDATGQTRQAQAQLQAKPAAARSCDRAAFAALTKAASARLNALNQQQTTVVKAGLGRLRAFYGWSERDYVVNAAPLLQNDRMLAFEAENKALLARIGALDGSRAEDRCAMLDRLDAIFNQLFANNEAKWRYLRGRIDDALAVTHAVNASVAP